MSFSTYSAEDSFYCGRKPEIIIISSSKKVPNGKKHQLFRCMFHIHRKKTVKESVMIENEWSIPFVAVNFSRYEPSRNSVLLAKCRFSFQLFNACFEREISLVLSINICYLSFSKWCRKNVYFYTGINNGIGST